jgi:hypothetical protein
LLINFKGDIPVLRVRDKLNHFYKWVTWDKLTKSILLFLAIKLIINWVTHNHLILIDFASIFFYSLGLICGVSLALSGRRQAYDLIMSNRRKKDKNE